MHYTDGPGTDDQNDIASLGFAFKKAVIATRKWFVEGCFFVRDAFGDRHNVPMPDGGCGDSHVLCESAIEFDANALVIRTQVIVALETLPTQPAANARGKGEPHTYRGILYLVPNLGYLTRQLVA